MMNTSVAALYPHHHPYVGYHRLENSPSTTVTGRLYSTLMQQQPTSPDEAFDDQDQIPTIDEFRAIIDDYLNNLSPKKRDKALVDQHRYCLIQQVLRDPRNTAISTAQFRFWVKKMFQLQPGTTDLVCHDNKPVAMKEQIYDILVKAHREAHHGGRDKTSALVRRRFSWIPKELVARFVRHCPFCITRRNSGHSPNTLVSKSASPRSSRYSRHGCSFDSGIPSICTPSSFKEDIASDLSSGPPSSSDSGYEATSNYVTISSSPSPSSRRPYIMYDHHSEQDYLDCHYDTSLQQSYNHSTIHHHGDFSNRHHHEAVARNLLSHHTQTQQQQQQQQQHSPLFYNQNYSGYPFYSTGYYPNALGITPYQQQQQQESACTSTASSSTCSKTSSCTAAAAAAAAVAMAAANNTTANIAAVAAATVLMRSSPPSDLSSHIKQEYNNSMNHNKTRNNTTTTGYLSSFANNSNIVPAAYHQHQQPLTMPENAYDDV